MTTWTNKVKIHEADDCSYCDDGNATFILTDELFSVIQKLCLEHTGEWQALLIGEERDNNVVFMNDYYIPKQTVTAATVTNDECFDVERIKAMGIVGGIHSHGDMKAWFSATDHECTNTSPIKNNIVVNNKHEFHATKAVTLPCGLVKFLDANVVRDMPNILPADEVRGIDNITERTFQYGNYGGLYGGCHKGSLKGKRKKHSFNFEDEGFIKKGGVWQ